MKPLLAKAFLFFLVGLLCFHATAVTNEVVAVSDSPVSVMPTTNAPTDNDSLRAYVEVQAQLHATQLALERNQREAELAAARTAQELNDRLQQFEKSLAEQHDRDVKAMQDGNHHILLLAGIFAGIGLLTMLCAAYLQWRAVLRVTEVAVAANNRVSAPSWQMPMLGTSEMAIESSAQSAVNLVGLVERLEKRILLLEHTSQSAISAPAQPSDDAARITLLLGKGQSLLNLDKSAEAIECFDEILTIDANNTDALVKKGVALERQRKLNEAIECYDRAIAADDSVTIAYLYKGGVFNRLERFDEALRCYEKALHMQENGKTS